MKNHSNTAFENEHSKDKPKFPQIAEDEAFEDVPTTDLPTPQLPAVAPYAPIEAKPTYLTTTTFGYGILYFKKNSREPKDYLPSSLFNDEIKAMLEAAGFAKRRVGGDFVLIWHKDSIISVVSTEDMMAFFGAYVQRILDGYSFNYQGRDYQIPPETIREIYLRNSHNIFNDKWLQHLREHTDPILRDTETEMFFPFKNAIVSVTKFGITVKPWEDMADGCVWAEQIIPHNFTLSSKPESSHFYRFLKNVTNSDERRWQPMVTGLGYLMHHHFRESEGQAVVFYDETITDTRTPQGGSGKGLIVNAIKQLRSITKVDGKHLDSSNRFKWELITPRTQVVWLDDVKHDFDFSMLHSNLTDGWTIEPKHIRQFMILPKDSPKTVICSNSIIQGGGSTNARRQFIIELSNHYSRQIVRGDEKPIETEHGCLFFGDAWNDEEWSSFFTFMVDCAKQYLNTGLIAFEGVNVDVNRFRQATSEDFAEWVENPVLGLNEWHNTKQHYSSFTAIYYGDNNRIHQRTFTTWLKDYAAYKGYHFNKRSSNGQQFFQFNSA